MNDSLCPVAGPAPRNVAIRRPRYHRAEVEKSARLACGSRIANLVRVRARDRMASTRDLYSPWYGTRELLLHHRNPYGDDVNREIQVAIYGHVLATTEHRNEQRFAYPVYVVLLMWPAAFVQYATVSSLGLPLLTIAGAGATLCCIYFLNWPRLPRDRTTALLLAMSTPPMLRALRFEQLSTVVVLLLVGALLALSRKGMITAGIMLALATIKPQMAFLPTLLLLTWSVLRWNECKKFAIAFLAAMMCLLLSSELLLPGWIFSFLRQLQAYPRYAGGESLLTMIAGTRIGWFMAVLLLVSAASIVWTHLNSEPSSRAFQFSSSLVFSLVPVVMPTMAAQHNFVMLFPAAFLVMRDSGLLSRRMRVLIISLLAWTPIIGLLTMVHDVEPLRLLQMSSGVVLAGVLMARMLWFSRQLTAEGRSTAESK